MDAANYSAIRIGMPPPVFVAEMVSAGSESSDNYKRDYIWKRKQYQEWEIPEYWIIDLHRGKVTTLIRQAGIYHETIYSGNAVIQSDAIPALSINSKELLG